MRTKTLPNLHTAITLALALAVGTAACAQPTPIAPQVTATPAPTATDAPLPVDFTPEPAAPTPEVANPGVTLPGTYINEVYGYQFNYPTGWFISGDNATALYLSNYDPDTLIGSDGLPDGAAKVDVIYVGDYADLNAMLASASIISGLNNPDVVQQEITLADGSPALYVRVTNPQAVTQIALYTVLNRHGFILAGYGDLTQFDAIAFSLQAVQ